LFERRLELFCNFPFKETGKALPFKKNGKSTEEGLPEEDPSPELNIFDQHLFILDPLSVIIKLAILSNKSIGTKICISRNIIYFQEPGVGEPMWGLTNSRFFGEV
jgi:hypothetical protein